jgi:hypothetical protein
MYGLAVVAMAEVLHYCLASNLHLRGTASTSNSGDHHGSPQQSHSQRIRTLASGPRPAAHSNSLPKGLFATRLAVSQANTADTLGLDWTGTVSMRWILLSIGIAIMLLCVATLSLLRRPRLAKASRVTAKPLLSRPEQVLYGRLVRAFPGQIILAQVALSQLLVVTSRDAAGSAQSITNRFRQLVADFVVCAPDFTAVAVIELDDHSHRRSRQRERDQRKDRFLQAAGIKVIRVSVKDMPNEPELKTLVTVVSTALPSKYLARSA